MTERTLITEADFSVKALNSIKRTFPNAVTLGELRQAISDDPKTVDYLGRNTYSEISKAFETVESDTAITANGFDYSLVDEDTAQYLRKATVRIANSYADIGAVLAEAQERLANNYHGVFEKWYTSIGMKRDTIYTFIRIHNFRNEMIKSSEFRRTSENALEIFDNLPKMLQSDISSPSAPAEAVNAVLSGDITTHKDYIALKKQLEEAKNKVDIISNNYDRLSKVNTRHFEDYEKERKKNKDLEEERDKLLSELKEAREQPKETVTIEADPTESRQYKALNKMNDSLIEENQALRDEKDEIENERDDLKEEIENLKEQLRSSSTVTVPAGLDHDHLREFFEDLYGRADESFRDCCHFIKDDYPAETKEYVRKRVNELYDRFKTYIELNFKEEEPWL